MAWKLFNRDEVKEVPQLKPTYREVVQDEPVQQIKQEIVKEPVKQVPKERWMIVKEYEMRPIKQYRDTDGTVVNVITKEDFELQQMMEVLNGEENE